jgi:hypothetical protein
MECPPKWDSAIFLQLKGFNFLYSWPPNDGFSCFCRDKSPREVAKRSSRKNQASISKVPLFLPQQKRPAVVSEEGQNHIGSGTARVQQYELGFVVSPIHNLWKHSRSGCRLIEVGHRKCGDQEFAPAIHQ